MPRSMPSWTRCGSRRAWRATRWPPTGATSRSTPNGSPRAGAFLQVVAKAAANAAALWTAYRHRRAVGALLGWDAHMLRDIGLNHSDIESALSVGIDEDPSSRLSAISQERRRATREQVLEVLSR